MKKKMMILTAAGMLSVAGLAYGFTSSNTASKSCPLEGTPECPYDKAATAELPDCCKK